MNSGLYLKTLLFVSVLAGLAGCGTHKSGYVAENYEYTEEADSGDSDFGDYNMASVVDSYPEWSDVTISGSMVIGMGSSLKSTVVVRMIKDKSVSISIRPILGIEMGKIYFEGDTVTVVDKYHKAYLQEPVSAVFGKYLDMPSLQSLLLSYPFAVGYGALDKYNSEEMESAAGDNGDWVISPKRQTENFAYSFDMNENNIKRFNIVVDDSGKGSAYSINFSGYEFSGVYRMATLIAADIPLAGGTAFFELKYKSVKWDTGNSDSVSIPSGAVRYGFKDIMRMITQQ